MAIQYEVLVHRKGAERGKAYMVAVGDALRRTGVLVRQGWVYSGQGKVLFLYGVGSPERAYARDKQTSQHRHTVIFDLGYFCRDAYMRMSITSDHPQQYFDLTPADPRRWNLLRIPLTEKYDPTGPIILVGMGRKTHAIPGRSGWEEKAVADLRRRFPDREIIYRPKPGSTQLVLPLGLKISEQSVPIQTALRGASLVVCRHSNVAVDAIVAGVPFEAEDGAAVWLKGKPYTVQNRLDFLYRLAYWQWHQGELFAAAQFAQSIIDRVPKPGRPE